MVRLAEQLLCIVVSLWLALPVFQTQEVSRSLHPGFPLGRPDVVLVGFDLCNATTPLLHVTFLREFTSGEGLNINVTVWKWPNTESLYSVNDWHLDNVDLGDTASFPKCRREGICKDLCVDSVRLGGLVFPEGLHEQLTIEISAGRLDTAGKFGFGNSGGGPFIESYPYKVVFKGPESFSFGSNIIACNALDGSIQQPTAEDVINICSEPSNWKSSACPASPLKKIPRMRAPSSTSTNKPQTSL